MRVDRSKPHVVRVRVDTHLVGRAAEPEQRDYYEQALLDTEVATLIFDIRTKAGLSQRALAKKVGTAASVIGRLDDAGHEAAAGGVAIGFISGGRG